MNGKWSDQQTLLVIFLSAVMGVLLWLIGLLLLWGLLQWVGIDTNFWVMMEALSTATAIAALIVAGYIAYRELGEIANTRHMEVADRLFEELNAEDNIAARRWIYHNLPDDAEANIASLTAEGKENVKSVLNSLDRVAFLTQAGWIPEKMVMPWMSTMVVKAWSKLEPYVEYESERRGEPEYYVNVRSLSKQCIAWRAMNLPKSEITWVEDAL